MQDPRLLSSLLLAVAALCVSVCAATAIARDLGAPSISDEKAIAQACGDSPDAAAYREALIGDADDATRARHLEARETFCAAEAAYAEWEKIEIKGDEDAFRAQIERKKEGASALSKQLRQVTVHRLRYWSLAATFRQGSVLGELARTLEEAECPPSFDADTCRGLLSGLKDAAADVHRRARALHAKVAAAADEVDADNAWIHLARARLEEAKGATAAPRADDREP